MSFSSEVKSELCTAPLEPFCYALAEAYGVLLFCNHFSPFRIRITTLSQHFARRLPDLFETAFGVSFDAVPKDLDQPRLTFEITSKPALRSIMDKFGYSQQGLMSHHINYAALEDEQAHAAFCRGAFLASGSVTDPTKGYHLELSTNHMYVHRELQALIPELGLNPRQTARKANYITYFKQSDAISRFLCAIGAPNSAQSIAKARQEKNLLNGVNRQYNCDVANVEKAVQAAQTQIESIHCLAERGDLDTLPEKLRETAQLRCAYPELSLIQLAAICQPPISKSCLNHRLRKLQLLAQSK